MPFFQFSSPRSNINGKPLKKFLINTPPERGWLLSQFVLWRIRGATILQCGSVAKAIPFSGRGATQS